MNKEFNNTLAIIVGIMAFLVVLYRIFILMIPQLEDAVKNKNIPQFLSALTLLV